jgi:preprotein translocase subunit SecG
MGTFLLSLLLFVGIFLMLVILIQRGRGGGLAGAFGGLGGQSAFGTKAGDVFTVITIVTAVLWVVLACVAGWQLRREAAPSSYFTDDGVAADAVGVAPDEKAEGAAPVGKAPADDKGEEEAKEADGAKKTDEGAAEPKQEAEPKPGEPDQEKKSE